MISVGQWMRRRRAGRRLFNPYIAGTPVFDERLFYGRESATRWALGRLASGNVRVTGERRIGKTSFLHHLRRVLAAQAGERRVFPVFVDLESVTEADLFRILLEETVDAVAVPETAPRLDAADGRYGAADFARDLRLVLDELRSRSGRPPLLVYLIDEADALVDRPGPAEPSLAALSGRWPDEVRVVLASVGRNGNGREEHRSLDAFDEIELRPLTEEAAAALVQEPVAGVVRYEAAAVARILEWSRHRPYLIQRLCVRLIDRVLEEGRRVVGPADVDAEA
ncbi:MAG TPA: ATP-binding protein [Vicinamibacteria bacterium]|nr:ATP-binding protein [Vicinamibacteria bacterium]